MIFESFRSVCEMAKKEISIIMRWKSSNKFHDSDFNFDWPEYVGNKPMNTLLNEQVNIIRSLTGTT